MADEIDRGQAEGVVAKVGDHSGNQYSGNARSPGNSTATLEELGVSSQRVSEWRAVRDAGEEAVEDAIREAMEDGRPPTKSGILRKTARVSSAKIRRLILSRSRTWESRISASASVSMP